MIKRGLLAVWIGFILFLQSVSETDALKCYVCNEVSCGDEFNPDLEGVITTACEGSCYKSKLEVDSSVIRMCSSEPLKDACKKNDDGMEICACNSNLCNQATSQHVTTATAYTTALSVLVLRYALFTQ